MDNFSNLTNITFNETNSNIMKDINEYGATVFLIITLILFILWCIQNKRNYKDITKKLITFQEPIKNFENIVKSYIDIENINKKSWEIKRKRSSSELQPLKIGNFDIKELPQSDKELNKLEINL